MSRTLHLIYYHFNIGFAGKVPGVCFCALRWCIWLLCMCGIVLLFERWPGNFPHNLVHKFKGLNIFDATIQGLYLLTWITLIFAQGAGGVAQSHLSPIDTNHLHNLPAFSQLRRRHHHGRSRHHRRKYTRTSSSLKFLAGHLCKHCAPEDLGDV